MTRFTPPQVAAATQAHNTVFFDASLNPVKPAEGQWFCEFDLITPCEGAPYLRDEALVEYVGAVTTTTADGLTRNAHFVCPEGDDAAREPRGLVLILQR